MAASNEVRELISPVGPAAWSRRWARARYKAASLGPGAPVVLTETTELGAAVWQAPPPPHRGLVPLSEVELTGLWITSPTGSLVGRWWRKAQLRALFAPDRGFGSAGDTPTGHLACWIAGAVAGAAAGGYGVGGPLALVWGGLLGAVLAYGVTAAVVLTAKRHVHGPVNAADPDLLATVLRLLEVRGDVLSLADLTGGIEIRATIRELLWQVTDPDTTDAEYHNIRYQAQVLAAAVGDARRAQMVLQTVASSGDTASVGVPAGGRADRLTRSAAAAIGRLQAHTAAMGEVTDQLRALQRPTNPR